MKPRCALEDASQQPWVQPTRQRLPTGTTRTTSGRYQTPRSRGGSGTTPSQGATALNDPSNIPSFSLLDPLGSDDHILRPPETPLKRSGLDLGVTKGHTTPRVSPSNTSPHAPPRRPRGRPGSPACLFTLVPVRLLRLSVPSLDSGV